MTAQASLSAHSARIGARQVTIAELRELKAPKKIGPNHLPVSHIELIEAIESEIHEQLGAKVMSRQIAVGKGLEGGRDAAMFGVLTLNYGEKKDLTAAMGFRHAHDMSISIQMVAGMSVFVCDNMVMRGDVIMLKKKHTTNLELGAEVKLGVSKFKEHYGQLLGMVADLKDRKLSDPDAKVLMYDAFTASEMPIRFLPAIDREYFQPRRREFEPRNAWSLHNAFTEVLKQLPVVPRMKHTQSLGRLFGMTQEAHDNRA